MFERFTDRARRVLTLAQEEARALNHGFIGTEHILLGLIQEGDGLGARALRSLGVSPDAVRGQVKEIVGESAIAEGGSPPFTPRSKKVLELALREALQLNHSYIGTEHILLGLVQEGHGVAVTVLANLGVDLGRVRQALNHLMTGNGESEAHTFEPSEGIALEGPQPAEPCCPQCRSSLAESARFRTMALPAAAEDAGGAGGTEGTGPLSVHVVYCISCGSTLQLLMPGGAQGAT